MKRSAIFLLLPFVAGIINSSAIAQGPAVGAAVPMQTVTILSVNTSVCGGGFLKVRYRVSAPFSPGNVFRVEMSDENGSFAAPVILRSFAATKSGHVSAQVPEDMTGTGYRIRLTATDPALVSADNGSNITVNEMPAVEPIPNRVVCPAATSSTPFVGSTSSYTWVNDNPSIGLAASGTGTSVPAFTASNNSGTEALAHIKVRAVSNQGCLSRPAGFRITVYPRPSATQVPPIFRCANVLVNAITLTGPVAGTTYNWFNSNPTIGLGSVGSNVIPAFTTANPGGVVQNTSEVMVTTVGPTGCVGASMVIPIVVMPCIAGPVANGGNADARIATTNTLDAQVTVGPNPTRGPVQIMYKGSATQLLVQVLDAGGLPVLQPFTFSGTTYPVSLAALRPGTYYVQVTEPRSGSSITRRVIRL